MDTILVRKHAINLRSADLSFGRPKRAVWNGRVALLITMALYQSLAMAASTTVENTDRNKGLEVLDALVDGSTTSILYVTQPVMGQAHQSEKCTANFYLLKLQPGLAQTKPELLVEDYCSHIGMSGRLLDNGDVLIVAGGRVATWRPGVGKIRDWNMGSIDAIRSVGQGPEVFGSLPLATARNGDVVLAGSYSRQRKDITKPSGVVLRVSPDGDVQWTLELKEAGVLLNVMDIWATAERGAWLHVGARAMEGSRLPGVDAPRGAQVVGQNRLYRIDAHGVITNSLVIATDQMQDFSTPPATMPDPNKDPEGFQAALRAALGQSEELTTGRALGYGDLAGHVRPDGDLDLLVGRSGDNVELIRVSADGTVALRKPISDAMAAEGLRAWIDFLTRDDELILYGTLGTHKNRLPQGYLSWINVNSGAAVTRLVPLDELGLKEAKSAADEQVQNLEHNPRQQGKLLTALSGQPLTVALVYRSRRPAIQLDEGTDQLPVYTEARDERQDKASKEAQKVQRKANRTARAEKMNSEMAAAIGVSAQEYAAMSNKERKEAMVRNGDMNAIMAAAMQQAEMAQAMMAARQGSMSQSPTSGMTPEMTAAIEQARHAIAGAGMTTPAAQAKGSAASPAGAVTSSATIDTASPAEQDTLQLDANRHGTVEYEHPAGAAITLTIVDRQTGEEWLRKDYTDGSIYEYLDFGRYQVPLNRIAIIFQDEKQQTIQELTPVAAN